jgi:RNA polymerase sigma-70 factor (ECF subfamily)
MDEQALVSYAQAGDEAAFAQLFAAYHGPLTTYLYRLVQDREVAADLAQDTFLRAYRALGGTDAGLPFRPWLYRIATNLARNHHRRRRLLRWLPFGVATHRAGTDAPLAERLGEHEVIAEALRRIGPAYASAILLHHQQGLSLAETAAALGLTRNGAKARLARARKAFGEVYSALDEGREETR